MSEFWLNNFFLQFQDAYNNLKKILANKWEFVMMQADEQVKVVFSLTKNIT